MKTFQPHPIIKSLCTNNEFFIMDAVAAWRIQIFKSDFYNCSKSSYLTNMRKLIQLQIVNIRLQLKHVDEPWLNECKQKIDDNLNWATSTKTARKSCLNIFYNFIKEHFDTSQVPYRRHPSENEVEYLLSAKANDTDKHEILEKTVLKLNPSNDYIKRMTIRELCQIVICNAVGKINERDSYIIWLIMHTGETLENILNLRNIKEDYEPPYIRFNGIGKHIPEHITDAIDKFRQNSKNYLFETSNGKKLQRTQVMRNLKKAGHAIGLDYDLTPKILHGYVCADFIRDKRSDLEKAMGFSIS